jgi:hypothetical protein
MTIFVVPLLQAMWREGAVIRKQKAVVQSITNQLEDENNSI